MQFDDMQQMEHLLKMAVSAVNKNKYSTDKSK